MNRVEKFKWTFETWKYDKNKGQKVKQEIEIKDIEAIYINPRWKITKVGELLQNPDAKPEKSKDKNKSDSDSEDEEYQKRLEKSNQNGVTIEDFKKLTIPDTVMKDGMIFIWVEKEHIAEIICHLETQNFFYVENVCYVMLNPQMRRGKFVFPTHFRFQRSSSSTQSTPRPLSLKKTTPSSRSRTSRCCSSDESARTASLSCATSEPATWSLTGMILRNRSRSLIFTPTNS